ncbi:HlyD family secretion protein [Pseudaminobacter sp. 19-2017]|uniref:HlyD family secretion protein n=1 Tax=Pseudaminobacter soli (ex Zhang et al. 2022) TaxID=2831468 RepID=A0A942DY23_9HYPH|nr:HlyD family secretion protein [Pseudaminobacter soli]MBS3650304.1 HlyD family secretion protein [Pseudaminobacter soli]
MNARTKADETAEKIDMTVADAATPAPKPKLRRFRRFVLMLALPLLLAAGGGYHWMTGGRIQETDNANLRQARVTISSEASGRVVEVNLAENAMVKAGDVLFAIDPEPYRIALNQADAALAQARLQVEQLRASYSQAIAQQKLAREEVAFQKTLLDRQSALTQKGIGTQSALDTARHDLEKAQQQQATSEQVIASARAALGGDPEIPTDQHPSVLAAQAARDKAAWQLGLTTVRAPADGIISQAASFKSGQMVSVGTPLFSLVETGDTWVEANFKETQLTNMKLGQEADVWLDTYPNRPIKAKVDSIGAGTGSEFSLLPAQNATGNWVKVTQRIPVRLKLESDDPSLLLRTGMSATVEVDTGVQRHLGDLFGTAFAAE